MRRRFWWCWIVVAALAAAVLAQTAASAAGLRLTRSHRATSDDKRPTRTYASPFVLADPEDRREVFAATVEMRSRTCRVLHSGNAGRSWQLLDASPSPAAYPFCFHTSGGVTQSPMAWGRDGTLYLALAGWNDTDGGARGNFSVILARSTDRGRSWKTTIVRDARGKTGPETENNRPVSSLVVDTKHGTQDIVYVAWRGNWPQAKPAVPSSPMLAVSTDGGRTFGAPVDASKGYGETVKNKEGQDEPVLGGNPQAALADDGSLYMLFPGAVSGNVTPRPPLPLLLARSTDRGKSFTVTEASPPSAFYGGQILKWTASGGRLGTLHTVYEDKPGQPQGDRDIFYRQSRDGGKTWSDARIVHDDDPKQLIGQFIPNMDVAPNGRVDIVWWDFRNDPGLYVNDVYYTYSSDNGRNWSENLRVTDRSINRRIGPWSNNFDLRQPPGVSSTDVAAVFAWDDTREGDEVGQGQDVFSAAGQFKALGTGSSNSLRYALAVVGGLAVVGLILLLVSFFGGTGLKRQPRAPTRRPEREPAEIT